MPDQKEKSWFYDPQEKTLLGRTASSWAKILFFYLIYYSFLAILIWLFVTQYASKLPDPTASSAEEQEENKKIIFPKINTRVDQPGSSIFPQSLIPYGYDGENKLILNTLVDFTKENLELDKEEWDREYEPKDGQAGNYFYARYMLKFASKYNSSEKACDSTGWSWIDVRLNIWASGYLGS